MTQQICDFILEFGPDNEPVVPRPSGGDPAEATAHTRLHLKTEIHIYVEKKLNKKYQICGDCGCLGETHHRPQHGFSSVSQLKMGFFHVRCSFCSNAFLIERRHRPVVSSHAVYLSLSPQSGTGPIVALGGGRGGRAPSPAV